MSTTTEECPICFEVTQVRNLGGCRHKFCDSCVDRLDSGLCPLCRKQFREARVRINNYAFVIDPVKIILVLIFGFWGLFVMINGVEVSDKYAVYLEKQRMLDSTFSSGCKIMAIEFHPDELTFVWIVSDSNGNVFVIEKTFETLTASIFAEKPVGSVQTCYMFLQKGKQKATWDQMKTENDRDKSRIDYELARAVYRLHKNIYFLVLSVCIVVSTTYYLIKSCLNFEQRLRPSTIKNLAIFVHLIIFVLFFIVYKYFEENVNK